MSGIIDPTQTPDENARRQHRKEGVLADKAGNVRVGLKYLMNHPGEFGYAIIVPETRADAPNMPFVVQETDLRTPDQPYALLKRERNQEMISGQFGGEVVRSDLLIHQETGMMAVCVERVTKWNFRVECIVPPQVEEDMKVFLGQLQRGEAGIGHWVVAGSAWTVDEIEAAKKRLNIIGKDPQVVSGEEAADAKRQVSKHPDRVGWVAAGKKVFKDPKKVKSKSRAKYAKFMMGIGESIDAKDLAKDAAAQVDTKDGQGHVIFWNTHQRAMRRILRGE